MRPEQKSVPLNIVLADDDIDDRTFFEEVLEKLITPTRLTAVYDGEQLMQLLNDKATDMPHVLFLDLNMPRKNGFECLSEIKSNKKLKNFPIIILTTSIEKSVVNQLYENGAHYYIRKPPDFSQFGKVIRHTISLIEKGNISQPARENFVLTV